MRGLDISQTRLLLPTICYYIASLLDIVDKSQNSIPIYSCNAKAELFLSASLMTGRRLWMRIITKPEWR